jgi:hypothetical protein
MRTIVLATGAALLLIAGVWTAAFTAVGSAEQPSVIGPAVVVGATGSPTGSTSPTGTPTGSHADRRPRRRPERQGRPEQHGHE